MGTLARGACLAFVLAVAVAAAGCQKRAGWSHTASPNVLLTVHFCVVEPGTMTFEPGRVVKFFGPDGFKLGRLSFEQLDWLLGHLRSPAFQQATSSLPTCRNDAICAGEESLTFVVQRAPRLLFRGEDAPRDPAVLELLELVQAIALEQFGIAPLFDTSLPS